MKHNADLRIFMEAFGFIMGLKKIVCVQALKYNLRIIPHPLNGQIDVQPISNLNFYPAVWKTLSARRQIYLSIVFENAGGVHYKARIDFMLDLQTQGLSICASTVPMNGTTPIVLIDDKATVTLNTERIVAEKVLEKLRYALNQRGLK